MSKPKNTVMEYRNYYLPADFPVLVLTGGHWKISDIPSSRLHFHNCLEIGLCHSHSGTMKFYSEPMSFKEEMCIRDRYFSIVSARRAPSGSARFR